MGTRAAEGQTPPRHTAHTQVKHHKCCGSPTSAGVPEATGLPPTDPCLRSNPECQELRAELEALSEEYRCCLSCLHQCRQELNQSQTVKVGPTLAPSLRQLHVTLGNTPLYGAVWKDEQHAC